MSKHTFVLLRFLLLLIWIGVVLLGWLILAGLSMIAIPACYGLGAASLLVSNRN